jgi:hypothetical protein
MIGKSNIVGAFDTSKPDSNNDPNSLNVFRVLNYFDSQSMSHLITAFQHYYIFPYFILENVVNHPFAILVRKLDWECLECVTLSHIVFNACLKLFVGERLSSY